jgi:hypothetical protein
MERLRAVKITYFTRLASSLYKANWRRKWQIDCYYGDKLSLQQIPGAGKEYIPDWTDAGALLATWLLLGRAPLMKQKSDSNMAYLKKL